MSPEQVATGITPDVSAYLDFTFYDPVYYYDEAESFPSTKERLGRWLGPTVNCGDAMTFYILTENNTVIAQSTVRPALNPDTQNHRRNQPFCAEGGQNAQPAEEPSDFVPTPSSADQYSGPIAATGTELLDSTTQDLKHEAPTIKPEDLIGYTFVKDYAGTPQRGEVKDLDEEGRFLIEFVNGGEELMNYNDLINHYNAKYDEGSHLWTFEKILDHRKVKGGKYEVRVKWDTGETTWEPMQVIKEDDRITLAAYARECELLDTPGWKWARRLTKNPKKFIRMAKIFASQTRNHGPKFKYGIRVPRNYKEAVELDKANGNTLWQDAIKKELGQINDFRTFKALSRGAKAPKGYKRIPVTLVFDVKFDLRRKARLVERGHHTNDP